MHWLIDPIRLHYADFSGRASRKQFWMFQLMIVLVVVLCLTAVATWDSVFPYKDSYTILGLFLMAFVTLLALAIAVPSIAIAVRRLHDSGRSGWWYLISFVPWIGGIIIIILECLPSQKGTNKWGANPYGIESDVAVQSNTPVVASTVPHTESESPVVGYGNQEEVKN